MSDIAELERLRKLKRLRELEAKANGSVAQPAVEQPKPQGESMAQQGNQPLAATKSALTPEQALGVGAAETAATMGSGLLASAAGGLGGLYQGAKTLLSGGSIDEAMLNANNELSRIQQEYTYKPKTQEGMQGLGFVGDAAEYAQTMPSIMVGALSYMTGSEAEDALENAEDYRSDPAKFRGNAVFELTGSPEAAFVADFAPQALGMMLGMKSPNAIKNMNQQQKAAAIQKYLDDAASGNLSPTQRLVAPNKSAPGTTQLLPQTENTMTVPAIDRAAMGQRVVESKAAKEAIRQGFSEKRVALFNTLKPVDKTKAQRMLKIADRARKDERFAAANRTTDVVGDSLVDRYRFIEAKRKQAGRNLNRVVRDNANKEVNYDSAINRFIKDLEEFDVKVDTTDGLMFDFSNSALKESPEAMKLIRNSVNRIASEGGQNLKSGHMLKKYLETELGKTNTKQALSTNAANVIDGLRARVNKAMKDAAPEYKAVNNQYADTKGIIDELQKAVGKTIDLKSPNSRAAVGTAFRRVLSNAQSRQAQMDTIAKIDAVANKYGAKFKDDILDQIVVADELEKMFNLQPRTSLANQAGRGQGQAIIEGALSPEQAAIRASGNLFDKGINKVRGVNEDAAVKAIEDLLK